MKKIAYLLLITFVISCTTEEKNFVTLQGKVTKPSISTISIQGKGYKKDIKIKKDLTFLDTLKVTKEGAYRLMVGKERTAIYLKKGYNLTLKLEGERPFEDLTFEGKGAKVNNFMSKKRAFFMSDFGKPKFYFKLDKANFEKRLATAKIKLENLRKEVENELDSSFVKIDKRNDKMFFNYISSNYSKMHVAYTKTLKGAVSPLFKNYENFKGGKTSLKDLRGKYVYIDVWATWCAPCKQQIPFLQNLEKEYHNKNIEFVSISIDGPSAYQTWRNMVKEKQLGGIQLIADKNFESTFITEYGINAIPRFILLDPEGKIIDANAYLPSNPKIKEWFTSLGIN